MTGNSDTGNTDVNSVPTQTTFVYHRETGEVIHIHRYVPATADGRCSDEEMAETALALAPTWADRGSLGTLHQGAFELSAQDGYRVDLGTGQLQTERLRPTTPWQINTR
ncbi:hypothetical protein [Mycolicibacterium mengxianglii]|uniref:hypothetical protein n=1 Tax=Mycolicibacterium mengxianglii TaxID=2736649 RepID=UPI0018EF02D7|nr:hypothetical protein [Mycolicibacterium mengxianglii]